MASRQIEKLKKLPTFEEVSMRFKMINNDCYKAQFRNSFRIAALLESCTVGRQQQAN